jgi:phosphoribosylaminoimidazole-succinocarboxamide synthase
MYGLGDRILMVASDRISTYDVVHPTPIPDKGAVLTGLSAFWFGRTGHIVANHFVSATDGVPDEVRARAMAVRKLRMLPVECVVRGYITGSGWKDYQATGSVSGIELPPGLRESERLPTPIPDKGKVLTALSVTWFDLTRDIVPNHLLSVTDGVPDEFRGRGMRVKRLQMLPVECVVRGYITGSGWKDYQAAPAHGRFLQRQRPFCRIQWPDWHPSRPGVGSTCDSHPESL